MPAPTPSDDSFGARLRRERERRQIRLSSIAENSKISVSHFEDLERNDVSRWPGGIFRKAYIREYAKAVGLDVDATTREFLERFPDPLELVGNPVDAIETRKQGAPRTDDVKLIPPPPVDPNQPKTVLRVTLADTENAFSGGSLVSLVRSRWMAVAYDLAVVATLGLLLYAVLGHLWMPLCAVLIGYYAGGILLLGNTPGVCFVAPGGRPESSSARRTA
jgi:transcriptional regulator with XRE-family HTH domain